MRLPTIVLMITGLTACAMMGGRLHDSAGDLEDRTDRFYDDLRRDGADTMQLREARTLAEAADEFNRAVKDGEPREDLDDEFDRLARAYHDARKRYERDRLNAEERERFEPITTAYLEVEGALKYR